MEWKTNLFFILIESYVNNPTQSLPSRQLKIWQFCFVCLSGHFVGPVAPNAWEVQVDGAAGPSITPKRQLRIT